MPERLGAMSSVDQALRRHLIDEMSSANTTKPRIAEQLEIVDRSNTNMLKHMLAACGWPRTSVHGDKAVGDAWLLAQHADHDPDFQSTAIRLLQSAVQLGEASGVQLAYLSDRVATSRKRPQLYGTQFNVVGECGLELMPVDDIIEVEERRKQAGMPTMAEYREQLIRHALPPHCTKDAK